MAGSVAGSPLAQAMGTDADKTAQDASNQARTTQTDQHAENAAGIGETEEDSETSDRDADGRKPWERIQGKPADDASQTPPGESVQSKDPTGQTGTQLDLSG